MSDPQQPVHLLLMQQELDFILSVLRRTDPTDEFPDHAAHLLLFSNAPRRWRLRVIGASDD
jgi:hypothetical protein